MGLQAFAVGQHRRDLAKGLGAGLGGLLNRPGTAGSTDRAATPTRVPAASGNGLMYGELMEMYDPGLTSMLIPGMVLR